MKPLKLLSTLFYMITLAAFGQDHQHLKPDKPGNKFVREIRPGSYATLSIKQREKIHQKDTVVLLEPMYRPNEFKHHEMAISGKLHQQKSLPEDSLIIIPVVFHIIHDGDDVGTGSNISDEQIYSAISRTNLHLSKSYENAYDFATEAADTKIQICLANVDPDGNPTTGINRINGCSVTDYCMEGITAGQGQGANELDVKNLSRWPNQEYYNIWVVTEIENNNAGGGIQGYAYFPTTSPVDGTVVVFNALGTVGNLKVYTDENTTLTHELGHAFGLFHTFQGGTCSEGACEWQGDRVCDTPPTILNTNCGSPACSGTQQIENFMDYTNENCKNTFTAGQAERMRLSIANSRPNLLASSTSSCTQQISSVEYWFDLKPIICNTNRDLDVWIKNTGQNPIYSASFQYGSSFQNILAHDFLGFLAVGDSVKMSLAGDETLKRVVGMRSTAVNDFYETGPIVKDSSSVGNNRIKFRTKPDVLGGQNYISVYSLAEGKKVFEVEAFPNFAGGQTFVDSTCLQGSPYLISFGDLVGDGFAAPYPTEGDEPFFQAIWLNGFDGPDTLIHVDENTFTCDSVSFLTQDFQFIGCTPPAPLFMMYFDINGNKIAEDQALKEKQYFRHTYFDNRTIKRQQIIRSK
jgi:hypothetical protein